MRWKILILALVAACAVLGWILVGRDVPPTAPPEVKRTADPVAPSRATRPSREQVAVVAAPPAPVDLEHADRELDLCGVVVDTTGTAVADAELQCVTYPWARIVSRRSDRWADARLGPRTRSAVDGSFVMRLERAESVSLRVAASGYAPVELPHRHAGERVRIVLAKGVTVRVRTVDVAGSGVAGTCLSLSSSGESVFRAESATDTDGMALLADLPPSCPCVLRVNPRSLAGSVRRFVTPPSGEMPIEVQLRHDCSVSGRVTDAETHEPIAGARVSIDMGSMQDVGTDSDGRYTLPGWDPITDVHTIRVTASDYAPGQDAIRAATTRDFGLRRGVTATGRAMDSAGLPIAGAQVAATGYSYATGSEVYSVGYATTGADGTFRIGGLCTGMDHRLLVVAVGFGRNLSIWNSAKPDVGDVVLGASHRITGRVVDGAGAPVARAPVTLIQAALESEMIGDPQEPTFTDDLGRFAFRDLASGTYTLRSDPAGAPVVSATAAIPPEGDADGIVITLAAGRKVMVNVSDDRGTPVSGAFVAVIVEERQWSAGRTDASGKLAVTAPNQPARIEVSPPLGGSVAYLPPEPIALSPESSETSVQIRSGGFVRGRIVRSDDTPPPRVWVEALTDGGRVSRALSESDGSFLLAVPAVGLVSIAYAGPNGASRVNAPLLDLEAKVDGVAAGAADVVLRLSPSKMERTLFVRALAPDGSPAPGASVYFDQGSPTCSGFASTGADGRASLKALAARAVDVRLMPHRLHDWMSARSARVVPDGQEIELKYEEAVKVQGHVVTSDGEPSNWGRVRAFSGGREIGSCGVADAGLFVIFVPATEQGPFRLDAMGFGASRDLKGSLERVEAGAIDLKIIVGQK